ncbi:MAG TPA: dienelactone hydrolase family protein [Acidimicrobiales bacterium]|nr:dienelactone hydrolase family protein [Acidimicrobiales bacterium]
MGEMVEFPSNGTTGSGYLATPEQGAGIGLIVIQEWWGLVGHIKDVCDRFAAEGFTALAPDLYRGETVSEPDEAGKKMMALNLGQAARDLGGAVDHLLAIDAVRGDGVGVTGFCMGGGLALVLATQRPDAVKACVPFYGVIPWPEAQPDWSALAAPVQGHFAEQDAFFTPEKVAELESTLRDLGKDAELLVYPGVDHAFFNDERPEVYDEAAAGTAWIRTLEFLRANLG